MRWPRSCDQQPLRSVSFRLTGILDRPNERSLHSHLVVRGAGISMSVVWVSVAFVASLTLGRPEGSLALVAMAGGLSISRLGG